MQVIFRSKLFLSLLITCGCAAAAEPPATLMECAGILENAQRLACYDRLAADNLSGNGAIVNESSTTSQPKPESVTPTENPTDDAPSTFSLARHWETDQEHKRGIFAFRPHRTNYLIATYSSSPNEAPYRPFRTLTSGENLSNAELAFRIGFKMKVMENALDTNSDLWVGYTQESFWQAGNHRASSPFRESNYQPEVMLVTPLTFRFLGMHARFVNLGFVHQSNGQASTLSRSWNRVYAQAGLERGKFTLLARAWKRLDEDPAEDDNPDINDYMGYGDVVGTYRSNGHELSLLVRRNFRTDRGAIQAGWAFPLASHLKGYVQLFSGYGQSLIDYNYHQNTIGFGFLVSY